MLDTIPMVRNILTDRIDVQLWGIRMENKVIERIMHNRKAKELLCLNLFLHLKRSRHST